MTEVFLLLIISILCSTARNIFSKDISDVSFGTRAFFVLQTVIFGVGCLFLVAFGIPLQKMSLQTALYAFCYGLLLVGAQYMYTLALKSGKVGICSTVYSLGFILPAVSGNLFWNEPVNAYNVFGIVLVIPMIALCAHGKNSTGYDKGKEYIFPLFFAMLCSGGLGIMQKIQQKSACYYQKNEFLAAAFAFSALVSFAAALCVKPCESIITKHKAAKSGMIGAAFAVSNLCNTTLSGRLPTAVFFPLLNIGTAAFSVLCGILLYKEKCTKIDIAVLCLGAAAIILISMR